MLQDCIDKRIEEGYDRPTTKNNGKQMQEVCGWKAQARRSRPTNTRSTKSQLTHQMITHLKLDCLGHALLAVACKTEIRGITPVLTLMDLVVALSARGHGKATLKRVTKRGGLGYMSPGWGAGLVAGTPI
jgi:hypothetical protein